MIRAGIRTHPPGIWTGIVLQRPLVVLNDNHIDDRGAVAKRLQTEFFPIQFLLDDHGWMPILEQFFAVTNCLISRKEMRARDLNTFSPG